MATNAGVWIDHKQAIVVLVTDAGSETKKFTTKNVPSGRPAGSGSKSKHTPNDFVAEDTRERKVIADRKKVYDDVLACLQGAKTVLILGPGEAKGEFNKHMKSKKVGGIVAELETADKLTEPQLVALVNEHFQKAAPRRKPDPAGKHAAPATKRSASVTKPAPAATKPAAAKKVTAAASKKPAKKPAKKAGK